MSTPAAELSSAEGPLSREALAKIDAYWRACNYLAAGMIYLQDNPLLREPLKPEHIKKRLLGHWGASPGLSFMYVHLNRLITRARPGRHLPRRPRPRCARRAGAGLPGRHLLRDLPGQERGRGGHARASSSSSPFPAASAVTARRRRPGSIHEGGELGYSLSHAFGAAFDNPDLLVAVAVGDGEAETGPLATAWHSNKFLNPDSRRRGAADPAPERLQDQQPDDARRASPTTSSSQLFRGYGWTPHFVEGDDPETMHQAMAATLDACLRRDPRRSSTRRASSGEATRARWPMIVLRTPKGWTGPEGGRRPQGRGLLARAPGAARRRAREPGAPGAARGLAAQLPAGGAVRRERHAWSRSCRSWRREGQRA